MYESTYDPVPNAVGLRITPVSSSGIKPFEVSGRVTKKEFDGEMIYYCQCRSFPECIVSEIIME